MPDGIVVACPECKKKFKPKSDVRGKKIKCPLCTHAFVVPASKAAKTDKGKPDADKEDKPKPEAAAAPAPPPPAAAEDLDDNPNPYDVKTETLVPRCPNCTEEMGPHDIICLACGYNTLTRAWGKTEKKKATTFGQHLLYLLPALGSAVFVINSVFGLIFYTTVGPYLLTDRALSWLDSEAIRLWTTVIVLFWVFGAGIFCFKKFIEKPKPDEADLPSVS